MLRDLLIGGTTHFADFAVDESIASNTLAECLQRLRDAGIIARVKDPSDGRRWIYVPRRPAIELIPVLADLMIWGIANTAAEVPPEQRRAAEHPRRLNRRVHRARGRPTRRLKDSAARPKRNVPAWPLPPA